MASIAFLMTAKVMGSPSGVAASGIGLLHLDGDAARARGARGAAGRDDDGGVVTFDDSGAGNSALFYHRAREEARCDGRLAAGEGDEALAALARKRAGVEAEASEIESARRGADRRKA